MTDGITEARRMAGETETTEPCEYALQRREATGVWKCHTVTGGTEADAVRLARQYAETGGFDWRVIALSSAPRMVAVIEGRFSREAVA